MLGADRIKEIPLEIEYLLRRLQESGIKDIARRIAKYGQITSSAEYTLTTLSEQDVFNRDFKKEIQKVLGYTNAQMDDLYKEAAKANYIQDKRAFTDRGIPNIPIEENAWVQNLVRNISANTQATMTNITQSMGFAIKIGNKTYFEPIAQFYQRELDYAVTSIQSGTVTIDQAIKHAVTKMADSGMRTVNYASGHKDRIDVAARRAVMGGLRDITNLQSEYNAGQMDVTTYEISWHGGYRSSHRWGGRRYDVVGLLYPTEEQLYEMYPAPDGKVGRLTDYNCYHEKYAVFPDSPVTFSDDQLKAMEEKENQTIEYNGKEYNAYDARQQQRYLERCMRRQQSIVSGYEGAAESAPDNVEIQDDLRNANIKMRSLRREYRNFSKAMGIEPEWDRVRTGFVA